MYLRPLTLFLVGLLALSVNGAPVQTDDVTLLLNAGISRDTIERRLSLKGSTAKAPAKVPSSGGGGLLGGVLGKGKTTAAAVKTTAAAATATSGGGILSKIGGLFGKDSSTAAATPTAPPAAKETTAGTTKSAAAATTTAKETSSSSATSASSSASKTSSATSSSASSSSSAASCPLPSKAATARSLLIERAGTGIEVCGIPFRDGNLPASCKANPLSFTFADKTLKKETTGAADGTECDHSLELQVLSQTLNANGGCTAINGILSAGGVPNAAQAKQTIMTNLFNAINGKTNAVSLDKTVNGVKRVVVLAGVTGKDEPGTPQDPDVLKAVNDYLTDTDILRDTNALATNLDTLTTAAVNAAETQANQAVGCLPEGSARQKSAKQSKQDAITTAKGSFKPATKTVAQAWTDVQDLAKKLAG